MPDVKSNKFSGGGVLLNTLSDIDKLPREVAEKLQSIVVLHGMCNYAFDIKRDKEAEELVRLGYFIDKTDKRDTIDKNYSRDNLFKELSKKQYDFKPNTNTTKRDMIDWILANAEPLAERLANKYISVIYSDSFSTYVKPLKRLLEELDIRHTYRAERIYLVDFYNEMQQEKEQAKTDIETVADVVTERQRESTKSKVVALILCILGGYLGLHHFYTGKTGIGVLYLFTVGLFGVGWIVDIVRIAGGKYTDKNGKCLK